MFSSDVSQRTIKLGEFRSEYELNDCQERFQEAVQGIIEENGLTGVKLHVNRSPNIKNQHDDENPVLVQLYAKVVWPRQQGNRSGVMELDNVLDDFNTIKTRSAGF